MWLQLHDASGFHVEDWPLFPTQSLIVKYHPCIPLHISDTGEAQHADVIRLPFTGMNSKLTTSLTLHSEVSGNKTDAAVRLAWLATLKNVKETSVNATGNK